MTKATGNRIEDELWFDSQKAEYQAKLIDHNREFEIGEIWTIQFADGRDNVYHFASVLKIDEGNYRFFNNHTEAKRWRVLRGIDPPKYLSGFMI